MVGGLSALGGAVAGGIARPAAVTRSGCQRMRRLSTSDCKTSRLSAGDGDEQKMRTSMHPLGTELHSDPAVFGYAVVPSMAVDSTYSAEIGVGPDSKYAVGYIVGGVLPNV